MVTTFENSPVQNPGASGIAVHFVKDETGITYGDVMDVPGRHFDRQGKGYYYLLVGSEKMDIEGPGESVDDIGGLAEFDRRVAYAESNSDVVIAHEMGHLLGLVPEIHGAIDSKECSAGDYPSVMNYNCDRVAFSTGTGGKCDFDDWGYIASHMAEQTNTNRLD